MSSLLRRLVNRQPHTVQRETVRLRLDEADIEVLRVRDPRARRMKLSVDERGVRLTLPLRATLQMGDQFLQQHRDWIGEQVANYQSTAPAAVLTPGQPCELPLRGRQLPVRWQPGRFTQVTVDDDGICIQYTSRSGEASLRRALREFYEAQMRADIGAWMPGYLRGLPRAPRQVRLKMMTSQWGSLAPDGSMALDLSLVIARPSAFEYVLVHELCHLLQANHSPAFWAEVEARFPHWQAERDYFHSEGRRLKGVMRQLLQG